MAESDRSKESKNYMSDLKNLQSQIGGLKTNVNNRFDNYQSPFDYSDKSKVLDDLYARFSGDINRSAAEESANLTSGTASRLASQGITGGSILNDTIAGGQNQVGKNKFDALSKLKTSRLGLDSDLMNQENQDKFRTTGAAQNVDLQNMMNMFRKYGMLQSGLGQQGGAVGMMDDSTWLDDVFAGLNTAGQFLPFLPKGGGASGGGASAAAPSDIRVKENIKKIGTENGYPVYEFNYIGGNKRYKGVMAQDVEKITPSAVSEVNGIKFVDYGLIGLQMMEL